MINIEDVTDAEAEHAKPVQTTAGQAAEAAEPSEQKATSAIDSPQTDANAEEDEQQVSSSDEQDVLVGAAPCTLMSSLWSCPCFVRGNIYEHSNAFMEMHAMLLHFHNVQKLVAEAEKCKESGNSLYKQKDYDAAAVWACTHFHLQM